MRRASLVCLLLCLASAAPPASALLDQDAPRLLQVDPSPGEVPQLDHIEIVVSEPVSGVSASDLSVNGAPAEEVTGAGAVYTFSFPLIREGPVQIGWDPNTKIFDRADPPNFFDSTAPDAAWLYQVVDRLPPRAQITPAPGQTLRELSQVQITFSEPVDGVDAADLLLNGRAATNVTGTAAGPYVFYFDPPNVGTVELRWATGHGIRDEAAAPNAFEGASWNYFFNPAKPVATVRINEILAANGNGLRDEDGDYSDWIELFNFGAAPVNLNGWALTDAPDKQDLWVFPDVSVPAGGYLLVFASGKDRRDPNGRLHANFKLNSAGEYLGLFDGEFPRRPASELKPFPEQRTDFSFGYDAVGSLRYFATPTPNSANATATIFGVVPPVRFSLPRGFYSSAFALEITSDNPGATVRFTVDGSEPSLANGQIYSGPITIDKTSIIRAAAFQENFLPSLPQTHTYIFWDQVLHQPSNPAGFPIGPTVWSGYPADYEMDPEVVTNPAYRDLIKPALQALPVLALSVKPDDLFGPVRGIYTHPTSRGASWEKACSAEFIWPNGKTGFQIDCGIQTQGNSGRDPLKQPKHPFRLSFKGAYGATKLNYHLFPDSPVESFDTLVLRSDFNFSWLHWNPTQRSRAQRTRDAWIKDSLRAMGGLSTHNRYVHLFLNGLYWGIYDPSERPDGSFAATYLGGEKEDFDVINEGTVKDGAITAYDQLLGITNPADPVQYGRMQQMLNLSQFIDYMLLHFYVGHEDWGKNKNWYAVRNRNGGQFYYLPWDGENILNDPAINRVSNPDVPSNLHTKLAGNPEYRLAFADHVHKQFFNGGALTPEAAVARWKKRAAEVELPIVAESARWGDYRRDVNSYSSPPYELYTRDNQWRTEQQRLLNSYFPGRTRTVLNQLRAAGLYPSVAAPEFNQNGGWAAPGFALTMQALSGRIYFTRDGSDPRVPISGAVGGGAFEYSGPLILTQSGRIKARALEQGTWSALTEADFQIGERGYPIAFSEIMYHPMDGEEFEFLELQNIGAVEADLSQFSFKGIDFLFPHATRLRPGEIFLLGSNRDPGRWASRYAGVQPNGWFGGSLDNSGERLALLGRDGHTAVSVTYRDSKLWPTEADGQGPSLEIIDSAADPNDPANWRASSSIGGSPGGGNAAATPTLQISEVLATGPTLTSEEGILFDFVELQNRTATSIDLQGWSLTDDANPRKFLLPPQIVAPGAFVVVWCDRLTNNPGMHSGFGLDRDGQTVRLFDAANHRIDAMTFGPEVNGRSIGRINGHWALTVPTPGASNQLAEIGSPREIVLNEWLANAPPERADWIELYNGNPKLPVALQEIYLSNSNSVFQLKTPTFIAPAGFLRLWADEDPGPNHLDFKLSAEGGSIVLYDGTGALADQVLFGAQQENVSEGRLPDGSPTIVQLPRLSPGMSNDPDLPLDSDGDGLPDDWEVAHQLDPNDPLDAVRDLDGDGLTNVQEYRSGTDPHDASSALRLQAALGTNGKLSLRFQAQPARTYSILYRGMESPLWKKMADFGPEPEAKRVETELNRADTGPTFFMLLLN